MGLLSKIGKAVNPVRATRKTVRLFAGDREELQHGGRIAGKYAPVAVSFIPGIGVAQAIQNRQGLKGVARGAASFVPYGNVALLAYDAKRLREKSKNKIGAYRMIRKQALRDAQTIEERLDSNVHPGSRTIGGLYDTITPPPDINLGPGGRGGLSTGVIDSQGTALEGPDLLSYLTRGESDNRVEAPSPHERGAGGDAAEGVDVQLAGGGAGLLPLILVGGLILAAWAAYRGQS